MRRAFSVSSGGGDSDGGGGFFSRISRIRRARATGRDRRRRRGYISSVKRKACAKLNFPRRDRPLRGCIAVGGLAIELRSDRCSLVYPLYETAPLPPSTIAPLATLASSAAHK